MKTAYEIPDGFPKSGVFSVTIDGVPAAVGHTEMADFVSLCMDSEVTVRIRTPQPASKAVVRPLSRGIGARIESGEAVVRLDRASNLSVEIDGYLPLFLFASAPESDIPRRDDPAVVWLEAGKAHELGEVGLKSGQTLYVEGGAVLRGNVRCADVTDVTVRGRGIIDGSYWCQRKERRRGVLFQDCDRVTVRDVAIVNPAGWTLVFHACHGVHVANVREIGQGFGTDGIDVVCSRDVLVEDCFLRNGDDNLVVKAFAPTEGRGRGGDVDNVLFQRCVLLGHGGSAMEIGHELRAEEIRNVTFRDCDILCVHGHGSAMSIHNADHATVRNVLFENIRVAHHFKHLVDFRVLKSKWSKSAERGRIRNVRLRAVTAGLSEFNPGYTVSLIGGYDDTHRVEQVSFENVTVGGQQVRHADDIDLYMRHASGVAFS